MMASESIIDTAPADSNALRKAAASIIDHDRPAYSLRDEVLELEALLEAAANRPNLVQLDISHGETRTPHGIAISPTMASMCVDDFARTVQFIRGAHSAIVDAGQPGRAVHVLYAGCGPYAALATPLMALFPASQAVFTLIDIHPASTISARSVVASLGFGDRVKAIETIDAMDYQMSGDDLPDVILIEMLQTTLRSEPQVAVSRHLMAQAPHALLVPERVSVELMLVDGSREFDLDGSGLERDRIPLGAAFAIDRDAIERWKNNSDDRLPGSDIKLPDAFDERYEPMLFTTIRVFKDHVLRDYDSGLTVPSKLPIDGDVPTGDTLRFSYQLGNRPGLICETNSPLTLY